IRHHGGGAGARNPADLAICRIHRTLEERLRRDAGGCKRSARTIAVATASGETLNAAAQLQYDILIGLTELLAALRHHVRYGVKVDGINLIGPEIWIQGRGCGG